MISPDKKSLVFKLHTYETDPTAINRESCISDLPEHISGQGCYTIGLFKRTPASEQLEGVMGKLAWKAVQAPSAVDWEILRKSDGELEKLRTEYTAFAKQVKPPQRVDKFTKYYPSSLAGLYRASKGGSVYQYKKHTDRYGFVTKVLTRAQRERGMKVDEQISVVDYDANTHVIRDHAKMNVDPWKYRNCPPIYADTDFRIIPIKGADGSYLRDTWRVDVSDNRGFCLMPVSNSVKCRVTRCAKWVQPDSMILTTREARALEFAATDIGEQRSWKEIQQEAKTIQRKMTTTPNYFEKGSCGVGVSCRELQERAEQEVIDSYLIDQAFGN